jgi:PAS domain S-box-containing protein
LPRLSAFRGSSVRDTINGCDMELKEYLINNQSFFIEETRSLGLAQKTATMGIWEYDHKHKHIYVSKDIFQILDIKDNQEIRSLRELTSNVLEEDMGLVIQNHLNSLQTGQEFEITYTIQTNQGLRKIFEKSTSFSDAEKNLIKTVFTIQDATHIQNIEAGLKKSEWNLKSIVECSPSCIFILREETVLYANQVAAKLVGVSTQDIVGKKLSDLIKVESDLSIPEIIEMISEIELLEEGNVREFRVITINQNKYWVGFWAVEIFYNDDIANLLYVTDITKKKESEIQLLQSEKMVTIGILAAGVAHEINNPIAYIKSNCSTLEKYTEILKQYQNYLEEIIRNTLPSEYEKIDTEKKIREIDYLWEDLKSIITESMDGTIKVSDIVKDIKSFAHVDNEHIEQVDINSILKSTVNILWNKIKYVCRVEWYLEENLPTFTGNSRQIGQVCINLILNAIQAIEEKKKSKGEDKMGMVRITTKQSSDLIGYQSILIQDTGIGISQENINRIYDPFFTTKEIGEGTGLGLSIVLDIIRKHNGKLKVESTINQGTAFEILFPVTNIKDGN